MMKRAGLAVNNVSSNDALGGVAGVDHQLRFGHNARIVIACVVGDDEYGVVLAEILQRSAGHVEVIAPPVSHSREERVVVENFGSGLAEQLDDGQRRRLAQIVDIALVGKAENKYARTLHALLLLVE